MSEEVDIDEYEERIKKAKQKREKLMSKRAEKEARLKAAEEKLDKLREKAEKKGFSLDELSDIIAEKRRILNGKISVFEESLQEVEERLSKYDD